MTKRGQLVFIAIAVVTISVVIIIMLPSIASAYTKGKVSLKLAAVRDISLIIDTVCSSPYDMELEYEINLDKFIVEFSENKVKIHDTSFVNLDSNNNVKGMDPTSVEHIFVCSNSISQILNKPKKLLFKKIDGKLTIT